MQSSRPATASILARWSTTTSAETAEPGAPAPVRARATYYILTLTAKVIEIDDIEKQVSELERAAELSKETG
jgi:hypothetical protein